MTFAIRLKTLRLERKLRQSDLAEIIDVCENSIWGWEHGKREPNRRIKEQLADYFECTLDYLEGRSDLRSPIEDADLLEKSAFLKTTRELTDLSEEMQRFFRLSIHNAYEIDKSRGRLRSQRREER